MSLDKAGLASTLKSIFCDLDPEMCAEDKATEIATAIDDFVKTALVNCSIPAGSVIISVSGGSGAPAVGVPNPTPINLQGDPDAAPGSDNEGGLT